MMEEIAQAMNLYCANREGKRNICLINIIELKQHADTSAPYFRRRTTEYPSSHVTGTKSANF
jgi:hypothetical protein